jgi:hypothetical protein
MWILPSRGRPHLAQRLFDKGNFQTPGVMVLDEDDHHKYKSVSLPGGWEAIVRPRMYLSPKVNEAFAYKPSEPWYGVLNDDHLPLTEGWDLKLVEAVKTSPIVWPRDNYADRISTLMMSGDLARTLGWVSCPDMNHFFLDDVHELLAECLGCRQLSEVTVSHEHVNKGRMVPDKTYMERPSNARDRIAFLNWCKEKWPEVRESIGC